jgi:hypothetical protein
MRNRDGWWLSIRVDDVAAARAFVDNKKDRPYVADLKEYRERRSLDANAYAWQLLGKLSAVLRLSPEEIYRQYIPDVGGNFTIVPILREAVDDFCTAWCEGHDGRVAVDMGPCRRTEGYNNVRLYLGSSDYDTAQMSRLIDMIIEDCKLQGIETMTPFELERLKGEWQ